MMLKVTMLNILMNKGVQADGNDFKRTRNFCPLYIPENHMLFQHVWQILLFRLNIYSVWMRRSGVAEYGNSQTRRPIGQSGPPYSVTRSA